MAENRDTTGPRGSQTAHGSGSGVRASAPAEAVQPAPAPAMVPQVEPTRGSDLAATGWSPTAWRALPRGGV